MSPEQILAEIRAEQAIKPMLVEDIPTSNNNGGQTDYYDIPEGSETLQDLIEYKDMSWSQGNIFKAAYRLKDDSHSSQERDLNKIIWFATRMLNQLQKGK